MSEGDIQIKIENLELFGTVKTYLFVNVSKDITNYILELYSEDNKLVMSNTVDHNTLQINNITTFEIDPLLKYFLKIDYGESGWHRFVTVENELTDDIEMIIHKKNNEDFTCLNNFFLDLGNESDGVDEELSDSEDEQYEEVVVCENNENVVENDENKN